MPPESFDCERRGRLAANRFAGGGQDLRTMQVGVPRDTHLSEGPSSASRGTRWQHTGLWRPYFRERVPEVVETE